jgi:hypothetical protein
MKYARLIFAAVMILILALLIIYSAQDYLLNSPQMKKYRQVFGSSSNVSATDITFKALILSVNQSNHTLRVSIQEEPYNYPRVEIFTGNLPNQTFHKGDLIDVIGIVQGKNQVTATQIWVDEPWKDDLIYLRSLPAIPFVIFLFVRTWKFDRSTWCFERRNKDA